MRHHICQHGITTHRAVNCIAPALKGSDYCAAHLTTSGACVVRYCPVFGGKICNDHLAEWRRSVWRGDLVGWLAMRTNERALLLEAT